MSSFASAAARSIATSWRRPSLRSSSSAQRRRRRQTSARKSVSSLTEVSFIRPTGIHAGGGDGRAGLPTQSVQVSKESYLTTTRRDRHVTAVFSREMPDEYSGYG